jgi:RNA-directed DNA polymerase
LSGEPEAVLRRGFARLFAELGIALDAERRIAPKALDKFKTQVREMTRRTRGISLPQADRRADAAAASGRSMC